MEKRLNKKIYTFKNIATNEVFVGSRKDFIKLYDLNEGVLIQVLDGKHKVHKNWTLIS